MVVHASVQAGAAVIAEGVGGHRQDGRARVLRHGAQCAGGGQAVHHRHLHVHQHQVVVPLRGQLHRLLPIGRQVDRHAHGLQQRGGHLLVDRVVFGQQHAQASSSQLQRALMRLRLGAVWQRPLPGLAVQPVDAGRQCRQCDGLEHTLQHAGLGCRCAGQRLAIVNDQDAGRQAGLAQVLAQLAQGGRAVGAGHAGIEQQQRIRAALAAGLQRGLHRFVATGHAVDLHAHAAQQVGQRGTGLGQVVGHQHAAARQARAVGVARLAGALEVGGEPEAAALALHRVHAHVTPHQDGESAGDGQAQAGAAEAPGGGRVGLLEGVEQAADLVRRHAHAGVTHREAQPQGVGVGAHQLAAQHDGAPVGELHRIAHQVEQRLRHPRGVAAQQRRHALGLEHQLQPLGARALGHQRACTRQHRVNGEVGLLQVQLAGFDLAQVEHVVDHVQQMVGGLADLAQAIGHRAAAGVTLHQVREADDGVHRRADLMADVGQEGALGTVGRLGAVTRGHQLLIERLQPQLGLLDFREVGHQHEQAHHLAALAVGDVVHPGVAHLAQRVGQHVFETLGLAAQCGGKGLLAGVGVGVAEEIGPGAAHRVTAGGEPVAVGPVGEAQHPAGVPVAHHVGDVVGDGAQEVLAIAAGTHGLLQRLRALGHLGFQVLAVARQFVLHPHPVGDVFDHGDEVAAALLLVTHQGAAHRHPDGAAVLAQIALLAAGGRQLAAQQLPQPRPFVAPVVGVGELAEVKRHQRVTAVAGDLAQARVDVEPAPVQREFGHADGRVLEGGAVQGFAFAQGGLGLLALGDITADGKHQLLALGQHGTGTHLQVQLRPAGRADNRAEADAPAGRSRQCGHQVDAGQRHAQRPHALPLQGGQRAAQHAGHGRVGLQHQAAVAEHQDAVARLLEQRTPACGLARQQRLRLTLGRDVTHRAHHAQGLVVAVADHAALDLDPALHTAAVTHQHGDGELALGEQRPLAGVGQARHVVRRQPVGQHRQRNVAAIGAGRVDVQQRAGGAAEMHFAAVDQPVPHTHGTGAQGQCQARLAGAQGHLGVAPVGDVAAAADDQAGGAVAQPVDARLHQPQLAVGAAPAGFEGDFLGRVTLQHLTRARLGEVDVPLPQAQRQGSVQRAAQQTGEGLVGFEQAALAVQRKQRVGRMGEQQAPPGQFAPGGRYAVAGAGQLRHGAGPWPASRRRPRGRRPSHRDRTAARGPPPPRLRHWHAPAPGGVAGWR